MFEAVVNSFQAIEEMKEHVSSPKVEIVVERDDDVLPGVEMDSAVNGFTVTDNGIGFTEGNLIHFSPRIRSTRLAEVGRVLGVLFG